MIMMMMLFRRHGILHAIYLLAIATVAAETLRDEHGVVNLTEKPNLVTLTNDEYNDNIGDNDKTDEKQIPSSPFFCSICPSGDQIENPHRIIKFENKSLPLGEDHRDVVILTCAALEVQMNSLSTIEACEEMMITIVLTSHMSIQAFCG
jgi:hypothetical protein